LDDNNKLIFLGFGDLKPLIFEVNAQTGVADKFLSIEKIGTSSEKTYWYKTFGAIHHETRDYQNPDLSFYYVAFAM